jgi:hypothetical protein
MTKRDILDVRKKHAGGRPTGLTEKSKRIAELFEKEWTRRSKWGQPLGNKQIADAIKKPPEEGGQFGRAYRMDQEGRSVPGPDARWRLKIEFEFRPEFRVEGYDDALEQEIAARLKVTPSDLAKYPERVSEELDKLLNDPESREFYFEYDPDLEYDTRERVDAGDGVLAVIKRHKKDHPEFKTRKRETAKAKTPKP